MAEAVLRTVLVAQGMSAESVVIESAGTHAYQAGKPPFELAVEAARSRGYELASRGARMVMASDFDRFDHILVMDRTNLSHLRTICPTRCKQKVELLLEYGETYHGKDVPDPYGRQPIAYQRALDMIEDGCRGLALLLSRTDRAAANS